MTHRQRPAPAWWPLTLRTARLPTTPARLARPQRPRTASAAAAPTAPVAGAAHSLAAAAAAGRLAWKQPRRRRLTWTPTAAPTAARTRGVQAMAPLRALPQPAAGAPATCAAPLLRSARTTRRGRRGEAAAAGRSARRRRPPATSASSASWRRAAAVGGAGRRLPPPRRRRPSLRPWLRRRAAARASCMPLASAATKPVHAIVRACVVAARMQQGQASGQADEAGRRSGLLTAPRRASGALGDPNALCMDAAPKALHARR